MSKKEQVNNFDKNYTKLQDIISWFEKEGAEAGLEESMAKIEAGVALAQELKAYLLSAENHIKELKKNFNN
jgi:exonuclease VII small subunit